MAPAVPKILAFDQLSIQPLTLPAEAWQPERQAFVADNYRQVARQKLEQAAKDLAKAQQRLSELQATRPAHVDKDTLPINQSAFEPIVERFESLQAERWKMLDGDWVHEAGAVKQRRDGPTRSVLRLQQSVPTDFEAIVKFTIEGGSQWRSVCLSFDATGENPAAAVDQDTLQTVYVSAVASGSKLQGSISRQGKWEYPADATVPKAIALNQLYTLRVQVRGSLINATLNDELLLAWVSPLARRDGAMQLETFDALATFHSFEVKALDANTKLREPSGKSKDPAAALAQAEHDAKLARLDHEIAQREQALLDLRLKAMQADWQIQDAASATEEEKSKLTAEAQAAHREAITLNRHLDVTKAQRALEASSGPCSVRSARSGQPPKSK